MRIWPIEKKAEKKKRKRKPVVFYEENLFFPVISRSNPLTGFHDSEESMEDDKIE